MDKTKILQQQLQLLSEKASTCKTIRELCELTSAMVQVAAMIDEAHAERH